MKLKHLQLFNDQVTGNFLFDQFTPIKLKLTASRFLVFKI